MFTAQKPLLRDSQPSHFSRWILIIGLVLFISFLHIRHSGINQISENDLGMKEGEVTPGAGALAPDSPQRGAGALALDSPPRGASSSQAGPSGIPQHSIDMDAIRRAIELESTPSSSLNSVSPRNEPVSKYKVKGTVSLLVDAKKSACGSVDEVICRSLGSMIRPEGAVAKFCKWDPEGICADKTGQKLADAKKRGPEMPDKVIFEILVPDQATAEAIKSAIAAKEFKATGSKFVKVEVEAALIVPSKCKDPVNGFVAKVGSCGHVHFNSKTRPSYEAVRLTKSEWQILYLVSDLTADCEDSVCSERDTETCCKVPPKCYPHFLNDVPGGCGSKVVNPYMAAFCKTMPCTPADVDMCCIENPGALFEFTDFWRSKYAQVTPDNKAEIAKPRINFGRGEVAWFDMQKKVTVEEDEWAPLVNFMEHWGVPGMAQPTGRDPIPGLGVAWSGEAWMKISTKGKMSYRPAQIEKLLPKQDQNQGLPLPQQPPAQAHIEASTIRIPPESIEMLPPPVLEGPPARH